MLEIAEVLPSRLQIASISHNSTIKNDALLQQFNIAQKERDLLYKKLSQIDKKRNLTQAHLKDYKKMMTIIKKNIGEKRLKKLMNQQDEQQQQKQNKNQSKNRSVVKTEVVRSEMLRKANSMSPPMTAMNASNHRFREQYLSNLNIRKSKKVEFNLVEFVVQINKFLNIPSSETKQELLELKDNSDLINPITGQINNPSAGNKAEEQKKEELAAKNEEPVSNEQDGNKKYVRYRIIHSFSFNLFPSYSKE